MNKILLSLTLTLTVTTCAFAKPDRHHRPAPKRPAIHRPAPPPPHRPAKHSWSLNITPWGSNLSIGRRVGCSGHVSVAVPLVSRPIVREEKTTVIVQQPVIVNTPSTPQNGVELNPIYDNQANARTWVEGYWKVTRDPNGNETSRQWVPGHWE